MHGNRGVLDAADVLHQVLDALAEFVGQAVAGGIGDVDDRGTGLNDGLDDLSKEGIIGAAGVLCVELNVLDVGLRMLDGGNCALDALILGDAQLVMHMRGTHADARVDTGALGILQGLGRAVDVLLHGAGQTNDGGVVARELGDAAHGLEVAGAGDGKAGLDDVDVET